MKKAICLMAFMAISAFAATSKNNDGAYFKDFVEFQKVSGAQETQKTLLKSMFEQFKKMPGVKPGFFDNAEELMNKELGELNKKVFPIYKKYISHEDFKEIIKFYKTPIGKKLVQSQPLITKEAFQIGVDWGKGVAKRVMMKMKSSSK